MNLNPLRWFGPRNMADSYTIGDDRILEAFYGAVSALSSTGIRVNRETALRSTAVLACLIVRSETFSSLPVNVLREEGRNTIRDTSHPSYRLLAISPNPMMHAGEFWRWKQLTEDIHGNAYARIVWKGYTPQEIWPLFGAKPALVVDSQTRQAAYNYTGDCFTPANAYPVREIMHFKGPVLGTGGLGTGVDASIYTAGAGSPFEGRSLIDLASDTIGISLGGEQFFGRLLGNGNHFPGYLETDATLDEKDLAAIGKQLKGFRGIFQAGFMRIFDRGLKFKQNTMSMKDAQLTEQLRWQLQMICSIFRVSMAMVQDLTNSTYTNSEQQDLWTAKYTMTPICVNTERVVRFRLFDRQPAYRHVHNLDGLLRGDYKTRAEGDAALARVGILLRNEGRGHYDLNPVPGLDVPLAELTEGTVDEQGLIHLPIPAPGAPAAGAASAQAVLEPVMRDAVTCIRRRYEADVAKGRSSEDTVSFAATKLAPIAEAYARAGLAFDAGAFIALALPDSSATMPEER